MILYVYTRYSVILYFKIVHDEQVCMFTVHCLRKMLPLLRILVRESLQKAISATGVDLGKSSMCFTQTSLLAYWVILHDPRMISLQVLGTQSGSGFATVTDFEPGLRRALSWDANWIWEKSLANGATMQTKKWWKRQCHCLRMIVHRVSSDFLWGEKRRKNIQFVKGPKCDWTHWNPLDYLRVMLPCDGKPSPYLQERWRETWPTASFEGLSWSSIACHETSWNKKPSMLKWVPGICGPNVQVLWLWEGDNEAESVQWPKMAQA